MNSQILVQTKTSLLLWVFLKIQMEDGTLVHGTTIPHIPNLPGADSGISLNFATSSAELKTLLLMTWLEASQSAMLKLSAHVTDTHALITGLSAMQIL